MGKIHRYLLTLNEDAGTYSCQIAEQHYSTWSLISDIKFTVQQVPLVIKNCEQLKIAKQIFVSIQHVTTLRYAHLFRG